MGEHQNETFTTIRGIGFTYHVQDEFLVLTRIDGGQPPAVHRSSIRDAVEGWPVSRPSHFRPRVGNRRTYIWALLADERIMVAEGDYERSERTRARKQALEVSRAMRWHYHPYRTPSARAEALSPLLQVDVEPLRAWIVQADESDGPEPTRPTRDQSLRDIHLVWGLGLDPDEDAYIFDVGQS